MADPEDIVFDLKAVKQAMPPGTLHVIARNYQFMKSMSTLGHAMAASGRSCCPHQGMLDVLDETRPGQSGSNEK